MPRIIHHSLLVGDTILSFQSLDQEPKLNQNGYLARYIGLGELVQFDYSLLLDIGLHLKELSIDFQWQCKHVSLEYQWKGYFLK